MATFVQSYGLQLVNRQGQAYDLKQLTSSDVVAFYFSAHWCPPCRHFTPLLKKFFETLQSFGDNSLKIIFISSDQSEHDMWKYIYDAHGDWLALTYASRELKERLERQYQVSGIPQLVVIDGVGRQAVRDARGEVMAAASSSSTQVLTTYHAWKTATGATASAPQEAIPATSACNELPSGVRVQVRGLTGAPEHNGLEGTVRRYDSTKRRYMVDLEEKSLFLRPVNLLQLLRVRVRNATRSEKAEGSEEAEASEWAEADIADFDEAEGEFVLRREVSDGEPTTTRGKLGNETGPVFNAGARLVVYGLQAEAAKQWNECMGEVLEYDEQVNRYRIQVSQSAQLKVKAANVRLFPLV